MDGKLKSADLFFLYIWLKNKEKVLFFVLLFIILISKDLIYQEQSQTTLDTDDFFQGIPLTCDQGFAIRLFHLLKMYQD